MQRLQFSITLIFFLLTLSGLFFSQIDASCFGNTTQPCCAGYFFSDLYNFCVAGCEDIIQCDAYMPCRENYDYMAQPSSGSGGHDFHIEYCDEEKKEFFCQLGFYTDPKTYGEHDVICGDKCKISSPEESCTTVRAEVEGCNKCELDHVQDVKGWCDIDSGACLCKPGFQAPLCNKSCPGDRTGQNCSLSCAIECGKVKATCSEGKCICPVGSEEKNGKCETCQMGFYGEKCSNSCQDRCSYNQPLWAKEPYCFPENGTCNCKPGRDPEQNCQQPCPYGKYGDGSSQCQSCGCLHGMDCIHETGECLCEDYLSGDKCEEEVGTCPMNKWGPKCEQDCHCSSIFNCSRTDGFKCVCTPNEVLTETCEIRETTTTLAPTPPTHEAHGDILIASVHMEWLVLAALLAAGMVMGVSVLGCYKLCCRQGKYVKSPSCNGGIRYKVEDDTVYISLKNSKFRNQNPEVLVKSIVQQDTSFLNGSAYDLAPCPEDLFRGPSQTVFKDAPGLVGQLRKNELGYMDVDKKLTVQLPGQKDSHLPKKIATIRNEYADMNDVPMPPKNASFRSLSGSGRPPLPQTPTRAGPNQAFRSNSSASSGYITPHRVSLSPNSGPDEVYSDYGQANDIYNYNQPELYGSSTRGNVKPSKMDFSRPINFNEATGPSTSMYDYEPPLYESNPNESDDLYNTAVDDTRSFLKPL